MVILSAKETGTFLGTISDVDLQLLIDQLEEEHLDDTDYYISAETIDQLEENGASEHLLSLLRAAIGSAEGVEISWKRG
jgi:hypothetical protein